MSVGAVIDGSGGDRLWGLDPVTRIERQLEALDVVPAPAVDALPPDCTRVLLINANYLFEVRTFRSLLAHTSTLLCDEDDGRVAAIVSDRDQARGALTALAPGADRPPGFSTVTAAELSPYDDHLRRTEPPLLKDTTRADRAALEAELYGNAYKGITDLVTKWWWPRPARVIVGWCAHLGISPNAVTIAGLILVLLATACFAHGWFLSGLAAGWIMTLLDTVDGKLARVTVRSSRMGHVLDHGMDIVHPPFWYVYWGAGLAMETVAGWSVTTLGIAVVAGYVGGRVVEGLFHALGSCSMFAWRPFDAYFRLVTARRNPCLIILTVMTTLGRADLGFLGVVAWTVLSTMIIAVRLLYAALVRVRSGPLHSWLHDPEGAAREHPAAYARFASTRAAYA